MDVQIFVLCRRERVLERVKSLLKDNGFGVQGCTTDQESESRIKDNAFNLLIVLGDVEQESKKKVIAFAQNLHPNLVVLDHFGGTHRLLGKVNEKLKSIK